MKTVSAATKGVAPDDGKQRPKPLDVSAAVAIPQSDWMASAESARYCRLSESTMAKRRVTGDSPPFVKVGAKVLYRRADLDAWLLQRRRHSTSDGSATRG